MSSASVNALVAQYQQAIGAKKVAEGAPAEIRIGETAK
jgi:hypothetical protein